MDRRTSLLILGGALPLLVRAGTASAGNLAAADGPVSSYKTMTLQYGTLSKETSQIALSRSTNMYVLDFAQGEILEQTAIAQSITDLENPPPEALTPVQQAMLQMVQDAPADMFDSTYLSVQLGGHESLLMIQNQYLAAKPGYTKDLQHIALIATAFVQNHLKVLQILIETGA